MIFETIGDISVSRLNGKVTLEQMVQQVTDVIFQARKQQIRKLMLVTAGLTGFKLASVAERYFYVTQWAEAAGGMMRVAVVTRAERIDADKFGIMVAENLGVTSNVFASEEEAVAWLKSLP